MRFKNLMFLTVLVLFVLAACGDKKKEEAAKKEAEDSQIQLEKLEAEAALLKTKDSLRQVRVDSIRRDSITKDSLRQVKEHGHAH